MSCHVSADGTVLYRTQRDYEILVKEVALFVFVLSCFIPHSWSRIVSNRIVSNRIVSFAFCISPHHAC